MKHQIRLTVNGEVREMTVESYQTLMDVLAEKFKLARTKEGCGAGECGSCSVSMDGKLVSSCLVLAVDADGRDIVTMEKLASDPGFQPVMEAFIHPDEGALRTSSSAPGTATTTEVLTFCHYCVGRCSVKAIAENGKLVDMEPDMESGFYSEQCAMKKGRFTIPEVLNHPDRLLYPQKRIGERGEGKWERISWDEALSTIAAKFAEIKAEFGPEAVAFGLGEPKGMEFAFAQRFASAFGTPTVSTPGWFCGVPKSSAGPFTYGQGCVCDEENTTSLLTVWGANMTHTSGSLRRESVENILESGGKLIVVDPYRTDLARRADLWIRLRPGSDGALAAGLLKVIVEQQFYDQDVVTNWTLGFDQLKQEVARFSLEEVAARTWLSRGQIEEFARLYSGTKPASLHVGNAVDQASNSFQTQRAIAIIRALCGNLNARGGDVFLTPPPYTRPGKFYLLDKYPRNTEKLLGTQFKFAQKSTSIPAHTVLKAILTGQPYPVKAAMFVVTNPLVSFPNSRETYQALMKLDFLVVSELFMNPTAALADIVLPVAWGMEHDELAYWPGWYEELRCHPKVVDPPGECWPDTRIFNELAKRLGLGADFWENDHEALDYMLKPSGMNFEQFRRKRILSATKDYRRHQYRTPSGKIEIYSERLEKMGYAPLPCWEELGRISEPTPEYPLLMTNAKDEAYVMSGFKAVSSLRIVRPDPMVELHPETARELGLQEGKWVFIETPTGRIRQRLSLNRNLDRRVVMASFGWWFPEQETSAYGWQESNINMLTTSGPDFDPSTGSTLLRGVPCRVCPA